jgi:hypothetical protein
VVLVSTNYTILRKTQKDPSADDFWQEVGQRDAGTPGGAVKGFLGTDGGGGTFVAVPTRSFRPMTVKVEQVRKVKVEEVA